MTLVKRLCVGVSALVLAASAAGPAAADSPRPLSAADARAYASAFEAADAGDFVGAQLQAAQVEDKSLLGYLAFWQLMHPTAHKASFEELSSWLAKFRDLPLADRIFALAAKRKPPGAKDPPAPALALAVSEPAAKADRGRPAREAFYAGDAKRALSLATASGERWIAGLSAWRLNDFAEAQAHFGHVAQDEAEDPWLRAAGAFWAARSARVLGDAGAARAFLRLAAQAPETFYGMIAERQMALAPARAGAATLTLASYEPAAPEPALARFAASHPRAHRAAALAQVGRLEEARQEVRAGLALATSGEERRNWTALMAALPGSEPRYRTRGDYPTPQLEPRWGFTTDPALVYAIVRQESAFNPLAVSAKGAVGLMQLMPEAAARAAGDDKLKADMSPLFDPAFNLRVGQDYLTWLMERGVGYDLLRTVAAYNGGPTTVLKTAQMIGEDDSLLLIECLPAQETRNYVERVMAAYWGYKRQWGQEARTLDALAAGARTVDARLDLADPGGSQPQLTSQPLQVGVLQTGRAGASD